jgi:hypothetical protein
MGFSTRWQCKTQHTNNTHHTKYNTTLKQNTAHTINTMQIQLQLANIIMLSINRYEIRNVVIINLLQLGFHPVAVVLPEYNDTIQQNSYNGSITQHHPAYAVFRLNSHLFHLLVTTFLTLFLKVFNLQGKVASKSAGNWFQFMMVLFTNEYLPMSVL